MDLSVEECVDLVLAHIPTYPTDIYTYGRAAIEFLWMLQVYLLLELEDAEATITVLYDDHEENPQHPLLQVIHLEWDNTTMATIFNTVISRLDSHSIKTRS